MPGLVQQRVTGRCPVTQNRVNPLTQPVCVTINGRVSVVGCFSLEATNTQVHIHMNQ